MGGFCHMPAMHPRSDFVIKYDFSGEIATISLSRPEKANSLTADMLGRLRELVQEVMGRPEMRALVLTGEGKVFSAGADLDEARNGLALSPLWEELSSAVAKLPCLTIAALNGTVAGGALGMVLACDLRLAVPTAKIFYPVMRLGFLPQPSDVMRLRALIGPARTAMILMAGQKIEADRAFEWGLIDAIVDGDTLHDHAAMLATDALSASPGHVQGIKRMIFGQE